MKKLFACLLMTLCLLMAGAIGFADIINDLSNNLTLIKEDGNIEHPLADSEYVYTYKGYKVEVLGYEYTKWKNSIDENEIPAVVVRYYFENGTDVPLYLMECFGQMVFQDGVELEDISLNSDNEEALNLIKSIKSGAGIYCKRVYKTISDGDAELIITEPTAAGTILADILLKR